MVKTPKLYFFDTNQVRKARHVEVIREHLAKAENSGFITQSKDEIFIEFKEKFGKHGSL